jgi:hypothetical protein
MANSVAKRKPSPAPIRAPKTRLNKQHKETLLAYMEKQFDSRIDDTALNRSLDALLPATNALLRAKYPEADMPTLRKYKLTRVDKCLKFNRNDTGRFFYLRFQSVPDIDARLADVVYGCYRDDVFACDAEFEALADTWEKAVEARTRLLSGKRAEYRGFLEACRYIEDVEQIVPLSDEVRKTLGTQSRSPTVINPELLSSIKSDFAAGVAA